MKHRVAAKGKNMYVILGLVALLLGSLIYLGLQKDTREGMEGEEDETEGFEDDEEEGMQDMTAGMMNMEGMESLDMGKIEGMMKQLEKKEGMAKKEGLVVAEPYKGRR